MKYLPIILGLGAIYILYKVGKSMPSKPSVSNDTKKNFNDELNYTGGGSGGHHGGGGGWHGGGTNTILLGSIPYYGYGYYPYQQPDVCYTKTKTGKLLAHYCNDIL